MKKLLLFLIATCFYSCYTSQRHCEDFRIGDFYSEVTIDGQLYKSTFSRTNNLQIEIYDGKKDSSEVRWINDCEVIYKTINPKNMSQRKDIHLKILTTTDTSYVYEYSYVGESKKQKGIAYRIAD